MKKQSKANLTPKRQIMASNQKENKMSRKITAKELLREVRTLKKQAGENPCAPRLIEYSEDSELKSLIERSIGPDGLMYGWGHFTLKNIEVVDGIAYFDGNISGEVPVMKVTPWFETANHPQVQKAFKELEKELKSFVAKNGLSDLRVVASNDDYNRNVDWITSVSIVDSITNRKVSFLIGGWDTDSAVVESWLGDHWSKKFSGNIDADVAMAVSNMRKFINKDLLQQVLESRAKFEARKR